ncbi:type II restriction endonuclease TdeIII [Dissulfurispira thermophila]|uniref:type II site-specific deoxyribonuclease n=1 Tax=Dissulfurispira thermophila TaxID=2715679 RepID=A0A7G1GZA1_9BACT|nr:TdeIII family type II restriction endonuclease [Dissulfurispira thermophila]BCB95578.1 type II restriction endonuclease TdeIII [Dissulfurispira thermophila]
MTLTKKQIIKVESAIRESLRIKFLTYKPETSNMPFHYRLLGRDRMALFSFIHSLNTTFGTSIFEPVAETLASLKFPIAKKQYVVGDQITEEAQNEIQHIMNELTVGSNPNKRDEIERIRKVCTKGKINRLKTVKVDLFVKNHNGSIHLFDIKTAKPNISNFKDFKRTLLEWIAIFLFQYPDAEVNSYIAIPYNPYEPKPYERWTLKGMLDLDNELKVAEEFWDFLGGKGAYSELLNCFARVGVELRPEIDEYFSKFKS